MGLVDCEDCGKEIVLNTKVFLYFSKKHSHFSP